MENTYHISIDLRDNSVFSPIRLSQYDKGYLINFTVTCDGEVFNLSNATAIFQMNNGSDITKNCTIQNNIVVLEIDEDITDVVGKFPYQICLLSNNTKVTTTTNYITIGRVVNNGLLANN